MERIRQLQWLPSTRRLGAQPRCLPGAPRSLAGPHPRAAPRLRPLCPDLVVELASPSGASPSDEAPRGLSALRSKMAHYQSNGARLGWLLIPHQQAVEVWPASGDPQRLEGIDVLEAGPEFPALQLQLDEIWAG
jgi:Uma2 family endonuclease